MESDIELMMRVKDGDDSAFNELIRRHYRSVMNFIYRFTRDRENSEDLTQEVFLRIYRSVKSYKPEAKFTTWLFKIATNLCITKVKYRNKEQTLSLDDVSGTEDLKDSKISDGFDLKYRSEMRKIIFDALNSIPERERVSIILCKYEGLSYDEVAEVIGCTVGAVKTYVHRGRLKLIDRLKPFLGEE